MSSQSRPNHNPLINTNGEDVAVLAPEATLRIALVGNPNSGKSSVFNALTGLNQKIGNYPGVTVDKKTGRLRLDDGSLVELTDLPGTYSLYPKSRDEEIVYDILLNSDHEDHPDGLVIVTDASNLKRNLLFCTQLLDLGIPAIIALSMTDLSDKDGILIDGRQLEEELGVPVVKINARKQIGMGELKQAIRHSIRPAGASFYCPTGIDEFLQEAKTIAEAPNDYILLQWSMHPDLIHSVERQKLRKLYSLAQEHNIKKGAFQAKETLERYQQISGVIKKTVIYPTEVRKNRSDKIDKWLTHKVWGYAFLFLILFAMFQAIFTLAEYPMSWVEQGTTLLSSWLTITLPAGWATDLLINGVIAGLGGIIIFIPQIAILFGFLTILEETGYMARVSLLTDRLMRSVGLNGKSVIPLMSGLACAIPAIMATRNIGNWKERLTTILVTPLISCSARLPVYTLVISLVVPGKIVWGFINLQGLTLLGLYILGVLMALAVSFVMNRILRNRDQSIFLMELPIYRSPRWRNVLLAMYEKAKVFTIEAGKVILIISVILWFLASYGPSDFGWTDAPQQTAQAGRTEQSVQLEKSFAGYLGKGIEPVIKPLGFDWKMGIALITSFAAREVFVGTMATIYSVEAGNENFETVRERMRADENPETGKPVYNLATAFSLLIFFAFAMQCMSTLAIVKRETKSWKWPMVQLLYMTSLAYVASLITYQLMA